jgi:molecular chaperone HtpG
MDGYSEGFIERNYLHVGSSRYQEQQFVKQHPDFSPISRFGIGALSAFMIADDVDVLTVSSDEEQARLLTLRTVHGQYLVKLLDKDDESIPSMIRGHGTQVKLTVRPSARLSDVAAHLHKWIVVPRCRVEFEQVGLKGSVTTIGFASVGDALRAMLLRRELIDQKDGELRRRDNLVEIRQDDATPGLWLAYAVEWNEWHSEWQFLAPDEWRQHLPQTQPMDVGGICIEGIRVTSSSPGYRWPSIAAIADATGPSAPKTNVARSAIESTREFDEFLSNVYRAYAQHVSTEVANLHTRRNASLTKAVLEASYLVRPLTADPLITESLSQLSAALDSTRGLLVEQGGERRAVSLAELREADEIVTVEGPIKRHTEYLLAALPTTSSIGHLAEALGVDALFSSEEIVLCTDLGYSTYFADSFTASWSPVRISVDRDTRTVRARWKKFSEPGRWIRRVPSAPVPNKFAFLANYERVKSDSHVYVSTAPGWDVEGLDDDHAVRLGRRVYLAPSCPCTESG